MKKALTALTLAAGACAAPTPPAPVVTTTVPTTTSTTTTTVAPTTVPHTHPPTTRAARRRAASVAPVAAETAVVASGGVEAAICAAWGAECSRALRVARCESGMRPGARNGRHFGLFQVATDVHAARIARMGFTVAQMLEVGPNIAVAHALWAEQGWRPWSCAA